MSLLVADYGASDSESEVEQSEPLSEDRNTDTKQGTKRKLHLPPPKTSAHASVAERPKCVASPNRSTSRPTTNAPSTTVAASRPSSLARTKKAKGPVKIYLPSVSDDDSDDDESRRDNGNEGEGSDWSRKHKTAGGMSALFAMLPKPKNSSAPKVTAMMPASVAAKGKEKGKGKETTTEKTRNHNDVTAGMRAEKGEEDDDAELDQLQDNADPARHSPFHEPIEEFPSAALGPSTTSSNFFKRFRKEGGHDDEAMQGPSAPEIAQYQYPYDHSNGEQYPQAEPTCQQQWDPYPDPYNHDQYYQQQEQQQSLETGPAEDILDAETIAKLGGFRGRHRGPIHIQTVDVSQAVGPYNPIKNASAPASTSESSYSHLKPSRMQKSKHNIMALAFQAKSMEDKLQESWSQSRKTKRQTQAKYGF